MPPRGEFVAGEAGALAVVQWLPEGAPRFVAVHLPAVGDEMNKSRRTVALQARALAALGGATCVLDPRGTGDSAGDFGDATWSGWKADALATVAHARRSAAPGVPLVVWGHRLGARLAWELVASGAVRADLLLLWQPVASARAFFGQWFRLDVAQGWSAGGGATSPRDALKAGRAVEIGGYSVAPGLVDEAEASDAAPPAAPGCPVVVRESTPTEGATLSPGLEKAVAAWRASGAAVDAAAVTGPSFWATQEIEVAASMIGSTTAAVDAWLRSAVPRDDAAAHVPGSRREPGGGSGPGPLSGGAGETGSEEGSASAVVAPGVAERFVVFDCDGDACVGVLSTSGRSEALHDLGVVIVVGGPQVRVGSHRQFALLARALAAHGYPVLRFDVRGMGDSDGEARAFESIGRDIACAVETLRDGAGVSRVAVWGLCDAASAALIGEGRTEAVCGVVALNPWARVPATQAQAALRHYYVRRLLDPSFWRKLVFGGVKVGDAMGDLGANVRDARGGAGSADFVARTDAGWRDFARPILFVLSGQDLTAREFEAWVAASPEREARLARATVVRLDAADHTFSRGAWRDEVARATLAWLDALRIPR